MQSLRVPAVMSCWGITAMGGTGGRLGIRGADPPVELPLLLDGASVDRLRTFWEKKIKSHTGHQSGQRVFHKARMVNAPEGVVESSFFLREVLMEQMSKM